MDFSRKIDSSKYGDTDLPRLPAVTLTAHVANKGIQAGSILGVFFATPFHMMRKRAGFRAAWLSTVPACSAVGCVAALGMLYGKYIQGELTVEGVDDRAYRIHHHAGQKKVDYYADIGG